MRTIAVASREPCGKSKLCSTSSGESFGPATCNRKVIRCSLFASCRDRYDVREVRDAAAVLQSTSPDEFKEIVDVLRQPRRALEDSVLVTPMLLKLSPRPICRIVGNLDDTSRVLRLLGLELER